MPANFAAVRSQRSGVLGTVSRWSLNSPLLLVFLPLAFDYRGSVAGGSAPQLVLVITVLLGGFWYFLGCRVPTNPRMTTLVCFMAVIFPVAGSFFHVFSGDLDAGRYVRVALPYTLMAVGFAVAFVAVQRNDVESATRWAVIAALVSTAFTFGLAVATAGDVQGLRHRVLSPVFGVAFVFSLRALLRPGRFQVGWAIAICVVIAVVLISVTRSAAITVGVALAAVYVIYRTEWSRFRSKQLGPMLLLMALLFVCMIFIATLGESELLSHWYRRLFEARSNMGFDLTATTRLAELEAQLQLLQEGGAKALLFGLGLGAEYGWSTAYDHLLRQAIPASTIASDDNFAAGHNFWVYSVFSGGLVFGLWLPAVILLILLSATRTVVANKTKVDCPALYDQLKTGYLVLLCFVASTLGGNPLGSRLGGLTYGYFFGLTVLLLSDLRKSQWRIMSPR